VDDACNRFAVTRDDRFLATLGGGDESRELGLRVTQLDVFGWQVLVNDDRLLL
jgi:hypothetical protein